MEVTLEICQGPPPCILQSKAHDWNFMFLSRDQRNVLHSPFPSANPSTDQACTFIYKAAAQRNKGETRNFPKLLTYSKLMDE